MLFRIGLIAIVASFVPWIIIAATPLLGLTAVGTAGLIAGLAVAAEVLFWSGLALAGKDTWKTVKAQGWRRAPRDLARLFVHGREVAATPPRPAPLPRRPA